MKYLLLAFCLLGLGCVDNKNPAWLASRAHKPWTDTIYPVGRIFRLPPRTILDVGMSNTYDTLFLTLEPVFDSTYSKYVTDVLIQDTKNMYDPIPAPFHVDTLYFPPLFIRNVSYILYDVPIFQWDSVKWCCPPRSSKYTPLPAIVKDPFSK